MTEDEELQADIDAKLAAIAHPEKFTIQPGEMEPDENDVIGEGKKRLPFSGFQNWC